MTARAFGLVLTIAGSVVVARSLGPEGRGHLAVAAVVLGMAVQFGSLGLPAATVHFIAKQPFDLPRVLGNGLAVAFVIGAMLSVIGFPLIESVLGRPLVSQSLSTPVRLAIPIGLLAAILQSALVGVQRIRSLNGIDVGGRVGSFVAILALFWASAVNEVSVFLVTLTISIMSVVWSFRIVGKAAQIASSLSLLSQELGYGRKAYLATLFAYLVQRFDLVMVEAYRGSIAAGHYSVAVTLTDLLNMLPATVGMLLFPRLSAIEDPYRRFHVTRRYALGLLAVFAPLCIVTLLAASPIVTIAFGDQFSPAVTSLRVLAIATLLLGVNTVFSNHLAALGYPWFVVHTWALGTVANVILNLVAIPRFGIEGAAAVSLVTYAAITSATILYCFYREGRLTGISSL